MSSENGQMIKLTGLWLNTAKDGKPYFAGTLGGARVMIFSNSFKVEGDSSPDYVMYLAQKQDKPKEEAEYNSDW